MSTKGHLGDRDAPDNREVYMLPPQEPGKWTHPLRNSRDSVRPRRVENYTGDIIPPAALSSTDSLAMETDMDVVNSSATEELSGNKRHLEEPSMPSTDATELQDNKRQKLEE
jgi:hypothetical protein